MQTRHFLSLARSFLAGMVLVDLAGGEEVADVTLLALTRSLDPQSPFVDFTDRFDGNFMKGPVIGENGRVYQHATVESETGQTTTGIYTRFGNGPGSPFAVIRGGDEAPGLGEVTGNGVVTPKWLGAPGFFTISEQGDVVFQAGTSGSSQPYLYRWNRRFNRYDLRYWAWDDDRSPGRFMRLNRLDGGPGTGTLVEGRFFDRPYAQFLTIKGIDVMEGRFITSDNVTLSGIFVSGSIPSHAGDWSYLEPGKVVGAIRDDVYFVKGSPSSPDEIRFYQLFASTESQLAIGIGTEVEGKDGQKHAVTRIYGFSFLSTAIIVEAELANGEEGYWKVNTLGGVRIDRIYSDVHPFPIPLADGQTASLFFLGHPRTVGFLDPAWIMVSTNQALFRAPGFPSDEPWERVLQQGDSLPGVDWTLASIDPIAFNSAGLSFGTHFLTLIGPGFPSPKGIFAIRGDLSVWKVIAVGDEIAPQIVVEDLLQHPDPTFPSNSNAVYGARAANHRGEVAFIAKVRRTTDDTAGGAWCAPLSRTSSQIRAAEFGSAARTGTAWWRSLGRGTG